MSKRELQDTLVDRTAAALLLERYPDMNIDALTAPIDAVDDAWRAIAKDLAKCPAEAFNAFDDGFRAQREQLERETRQAASPPLYRDQERTTDALLPALRRIGDLLSALTEWRHLDWEQAERRAGRDPHQPSRRR